jgi:predicted DNA-binding transcriptional regulator AlpA
VKQSDEVVDEDAPTTVFVRSGRAAQAAVHARFDHAGLWDTNDVARFLKVSRSWVYHRAEAGLLPCVRIGSLLRFDPEVVRCLAERGSPPAGAVQRSHVRRR